MWLRILLLGSITLIPLTAIQIIGINTPDKELASTFTILWVLSVIITIIAIIVLSWGHISRVLGRQSTKLTVKDEQGRLITRISDSTGGNGFSSVQAGGCSVDIDQDGSATIKNRNSQYIIVQGRCRGDLIMEGNVLGNQLVVDGNITKNN